MIPPKILTTLTINFDPDGADHVDDGRDATNGVCSYASDERGATNCDSTSPSACKSHLLK